MIWGEMLGVEDEEMEGRTVGRGIDLEHVRRCVELANTTMDVTSLLLLHRLAGHRSHCTSSSEC